MEKDEKDSAPYICAIISFKDVRFRSGRLFHSPLALGWIQRNKLAFGVFAQTIPTDINFAASAKLTARKCVSTFFFGSPLNEIEKKKH